MTRFIKLECPECGQEKRVHRADYDPPEARTLVIRCMDCCSVCKEDAGSYYDKHGEEVSYVKEQVK